MHLSPKVEVVIAGGVSGSAHAGSGQLHPEYSAASIIYWSCCAVFKVDMSEFMGLVSLQAELSGVVREEHLGVSRALSSIAGVQLMGPEMVFCPDLVFPVKKL